MIRKNQKHKTFCDTQAVRPYNYAMTLNGIACVSLKVGFPPSCSTCSTRCLKTQAKNGLRVNGMDFIPCWFKWHVLKRLNSDFGAGLKTTNKSSISKPGFRKATSNTGVFFALQIGSNQISQKRHPKRVSFICTYLSLLALTSHPKQKAESHPRPPENPDTSPSSLVPRFLSHRVSAKRLPCSQSEMWELFCQPKTDPK